MDVREGVRAANAASAFNRWLGIEIVALEEGAVEIAVSARPEVMQHAGFLHAGVVSALLDTAAGYAASLAAEGATTTSQLVTTYYRPATGDVFAARARVVRAGKQQIFVNAELFARTADGERLVAGAAAVLVRVP